MNGCAAAKLERSRGAGLGSCSGAARWPTCSATTTARACMHARADASCARVVCFCSSSLPSLLFSLLSLLSLFSLLSL
eukprot:2796881-Rhodomonas_salina.1